MFGGWERSLGGALDPVVNLQGRIHTCTGTGGKKHDTQLNVVHLHAVTQSIFIPFFLAFSFFPPQSHWFRMYGLLNRASHQNKNA